MKTYALAEKRRAWYYTSKAGAEQRNREQAKPKNWTVDPKDCATARALFFDEHGNPVKELTLRQTDAFALAAMLIASAKLDTLDKDNDR